MENKILYRIEKNDGLDTRFIKLSESNEKFLHWLYNNGYMHYDICFEPTDEPPKIEEF